MRKADSRIAREWELRRQPARVTPETEGEQIEDHDAKHEPEEPENTTVHGAPPFAGMSS